MREGSWRAVRVSVWVLCVVAVTSLSGCFDLLQEIWVAADGSARLRLEVALPKSVLHLAGQGALTKLREDAKKTGAELKDDPVVKAFSFKDHVEGDVQHLVYELEVTDATKLGALQQRVWASAANEKEGEGMTFRFEKGTGGALRFVQRVGKDAQRADGGAGAEPGSVADRAARELGRKMAGAMFEGRFVTVRVHGPAIGETNGALNEKKDTVEWRLPMAELMSDGAPLQELRAEIETGAPLWVWGLFLGIPALLLLLSISAMKRRRPRPVVG